MSGKRDGAAVVGVGVAACAACCAGPMLGVVAAIGLTAAAATYLFGALALLVGVIAVVLVLRRRRARRCRPGPASVDIVLSSGTRTAL